MPAITVVQQHFYQLTHRHRGQASSHTVAKTEASTRDDSSQAGLRQTYNRMCYRSEAPDPAEGWPTVVCGLAAKCQRWIWLYDYLFGYLRRQLLTQV